MFNIRKASAELNKVAKNIAKQMLGDERLEFEVKAKCHIYDELTFFGCSNLDIDKIADEETTKLINKLYDFYVYIDGATYDDVVRGAIELVERGNSIAKICDMSKSEFIKETF